MDSLVTYQHCSFQQNKIIQHFRSINIRNCNQQKKKELNDGLSQFFSSFSLLEITTYNKK